MNREQTSKTESFMTDIDYIENKSNYYAMFLSAYERCVQARLKLKALFDVGAISDYDFNAYSQRIHQAKIAMVDKHLEWTLKTLSKDLTVREAVCSVYNDIFSMDLSDKR